MTRRRDIPMENGPQKASPVRCAIYTRESSEEGLDLDFNSLDAQRESAENYIASQKGSGWVCLPDRYDDGGYSGGAIERPAFRRLMAEVEAGRVQCVVVYKIDRLSRSLTDFVRIMETLEKHGVSLVSVTQQFNTTTSMGRLTLNILFSFAQFERELVSERTRDKIAAARKRGKFAGGRPLLGYDLVSGPGGTRLVVNEDEAVRVRAIFRLYLKHEALRPTAEELNRRGWTTKRWESRTGRVIGGCAFTKVNLHAMLTNVTYLGKVRHRAEVYEGEHEAIVDAEVWSKVQSLLQHNGRSGGALVRNKHGALLKGLIRCAPCGCPMGHTYTSKGGKRYRYYVCMHAQKAGWNRCPSKSVPAGEIERYVVDQIRVIGGDESVIAEVVGQVRVQRQERMAELRAEERAVGRELAGYERESVSSAQAHIHRTRNRLAEVRSAIAAEEGGVVGEAEVRAALREFDTLWAALSPKEQARVILLLVERIEFDGRDQTLAITFRPTGIRALAAPSQEVAA